jgi:hypothetical protein
LVAREVFCAVKHLPRCCVSLLKYGERYVEDIQKKRFNLVNDMQEGAYLTETGMDSGSRDIRAITGKGKKRMYGFLRNIHGR